MLLLALGVGLALLSLLSSAPLSARGDSCKCGPQSPLLHGSQVNIAVLVWLQGAPHGLYTGELKDSPPTDTPGYGINLLQPYMLGIDFYVRSMRANGPMPLPNGESVTLNFGEREEAGGMEGRGM